MGDYQINNPVIRGLSGYLKDFELQLVGGTRFRPIYRVDELQVDMTHRLMARVYITPQNMAYLEEAGHTLLDIQTKLFDRMVAGLPSPRIMGVVSFGLEVKVEDPAGGPAKLTMDEIAGRTCVAASSAPSEEECENCSETAVLIPLTDADGHEWMLCADCDDDMRPVTEGE